MATQKPVPVAQGEEFQKLANSAYNYYETQRSTTGGLLKRSGRMDGNAELSDLIRHLAHDLGIAVRDLLVTYAGNPAKGTAAIYVEKPGTSGAVQPRVNKAGYYHFHLGGLFAQHPTLRPRFKEVDVTAALQLDAQGTPCVVLHLAGAREHHKEVRRGSASSAKAQAKPAEPPAAQAAAGTDSETE